MITFKPKQITKSLLGVLPERAADVLTKRYGLDTEGQSYTLESIGQSYGITRERVRQIENYGIQSIQRSEEYKKHFDLFFEMQRLIDKLGGGLIAEKVLLDELTDSEITRNHLYFLLVIGDPFYRGKENVEYTHRWYTEKKTVMEVEKALHGIGASLDLNELISEGEIIKRFQDQLLETTKQEDEDILRRWLLISKRIGKNPLGDWGLVDSPNVRVKGIRDYAYLAVKRHGSPMHFREVADNIEHLFKHKAHVATTHNELIKDARFVLVGRGLYALTEWGYTAGVVKDVLREILLQEGPLTKEELIDKVRKERYVKDNTIIVNLQDTNIFRRLSNGSYTVAD